MFSNLKQWDSFLFYAELTHSGPERIGVNGELEV
jgi:hypothetical protein